MLQNQVLHRTIQDIKRISGLDCAVWDANGGCLAMTDERLRGVEPDVLAFGKEKSSADAPQMEKTVGDTGLFLVQDEEGIPRYILALQGEEPLLGLAGRLGASQLSNLLYVSKERMDRNRFIQNLILDNLLLVDIYNQAKKLKIPVELRRAVFLIEPKKEGENLILDTLRGLYPAGRNDFVTAVDEKRVILVKSLEKTEGYPQLAQTARMLSDTLNTEAMIGVRISYGAITEELGEVSKSYKEADMALEVGRIFYEEDSIFAYNELGIGRLIHQLPKSLCEMFLKEVFEKEVDGLFEDAELDTVYAFFDNNLNISETARKLYIHRNTLVYRLDKIHKKTGLDVRIFDDALTFKIAMMVAKHLAKC